MEQNRDKTGPGQVNRSQFLKLLLAVMAVVALVVVSVEPRLLFPNDRADHDHLESSHHEPAFHSTVEAVIGIVAVLLGFCLWWWERETGVAAGRLLALGFWPMGVMATAHAMSDQNNLMVFLYASSMLFGGIGFSSCLLPGLRARLTGSGWIPALVAYRLGDLLCAGFCVFAGPTANGA